MIKDLSGNTESSSNLAADSVCTPNNHDNAGCRFQSCPHNRQQFCRHATSGTGFYFLGGHGYCWNILVTAFATNCWFLLPLLFRVPWPIPRHTSAFCDAL
jgi:hypothetical protein